MTKIIKGNSYLIQNEGIPWVKNIDNLYTKIFFIPTAFFVTAYSQTVYS